MKKFWWELHWDANSHRLSIMGRTQPREGEPVWLGFGLVVAVAVQASNKKEALKKGIKMLADWLQEQRDRVLLKGREIEVEIERRAEESIEKRGKETDVLLDPYEIGV